MRQEGTDIMMEECEEMDHKRCIELEDIVDKEKSCKRDQECSDLEHLFLCENGICNNITDVYRSVV